MALMLFLLPGVCVAAHPASEVQLDAGYTLPQGDLGDEFENTALGFGADPGLELGFLWRYRFNSQWSLAPAFHFVNYGDFNGVDEAGSDYSVQVTSFRYGLQLRRSWRGVDKGWQPFLMAGMSVVRNRVVGWDKMLVASFDRSATSLAYNFQMGVRRRNIEFGLVGQINRFSSWQFFTVGQKQDFNWDTVSVRFSWLIPGS